MQEHTPKRQSSWFTRQFLNSQMVVSLLILLLVLLIIWVFTRITHVFAPIGVVIDVAAFPIITSGVLYYLLYPLVDRLGHLGYFYWLNSIVSLGNCLPYSDPTDSDSELCS